MQQVCQTKPQKRLNSLTDVGVLETSFEVLDSYYHPADEG